MIAWPRCPECQASDLHVFKRAEDCSSAQVHVYRSYGCACGWSCWTVEKVVSIRPETLCIDRKFAPPVEQTPSTGGT